MLLALASAVFFGSEPLGTSDHILLSQIWDFPFRRLLRLAGSQWRYWTPPPHGLLSTCQLNCLQDNSSARTTSKTSFFYCCVRVRSDGNVFTKQLLRNGWLFILLLHSNGCTRCLFRGLYLATDLYVTILCCTLSIVLGISKVREPEHVRSSGNSSREMYYPGWHSPWFASVLPDKCRDFNLN
jgi:hypothetical protein